MQRLRIKRFNPDVKLPTRTHETDAGLDLYAPVDFIIPLNRKVRIPSGIGIALDQGYVGLIFDRSSTGAAGVRTLGGVIDANYRGEIGIVLANVAEPEGLRFNKGDKIAQLIITNAYTPAVEEVDEFETTDRGDKGFGSPGR